jgi:hypothetical protein
VSSKHHQTQVSPAFLAAELLLINVTSCAVLIPQWLHGIAKLCFPQSDSCPITQKRHQLCCAQVVPLAHPPLSFIDIGLRCNILAATESRVQGITARFTGCTLPAAARATQPMRASMLRAAVDVSAAEIGPAGSVQHQQ